jgi:hypothetical protein
MMNRPGMRAAKHSPIACIHHTQAGGGGGGGGGGGRRNVASKLDTMSLELMEVHHSHTQWWTYMNAGGIVSKLCCATTLPLPNQQHSRYVALGPHLCIMGAARHSLPPPLHSSTTLNSRVLKEWLYVHVHART